MDRRRLIVGGSAAVAAAGLAALVGKGAPAAASTVDAEATSTLDHARRILDLVDVDLGLVDPAGLQSQFEQGCAAYAASPAPRDEDPTVATMEAWIEQRMVDLCGTDAVENATGIPPTRTLLAFGLLACSQHQDGEPPQIFQGMPVPGVLEALEPDFLPVLLDQIDVKSNGSPSFATAIQASLVELDRFVATLPEAEPATMRARSLTRIQIAALIIIVVGNLALLCTNGWDDV
jgi:hypothetical protein